MATFVAEIFRHNLWANLRMLDACSNLAVDDLKASDTGTYGPIGDTLVHLFAAEARYVAEFTKSSPEQPLTEGDPFPWFDALHSHATGSGEALIRLAESSQADDMLEGMYRGQPYNMPANILYLHAINHATEHRAHINTILTQCGVEPPRLDGIAYFQTGVAG